MLLAEQRALKLRLEEVERGALVGLALRLILTEAQAAAVSQQTAGGRAAAAPLDQPVLVLRRRMLPQALHLLAVLVMAEWVASAEQRL